jgi:translocation and assembly module TamA
VEERPRLIFLGSFPSVPENSPRFGNALSTHFSQPGVLEPRTTLFTDASWDYGPDPFLLFFRHDIGLSVGLERGFFQQRLNVRLALHQDILQVSSRQPIVSAIDTPSSYRLPFAEQRIVLDLRDDPGNPTRGAYFRLAVHEAVRLWDPSWNYVRLLPEARGYAPLGLGIVLAARFALGSLHILDAEESLDEASKRLGPQSYRLRGGGAQSNRGFGPGRLGDGLSGGIRRWEGSLELRVPLTKSFSVAVFSDVGDVHEAASFRFRHLNTAVGGGMRYRTILGPIRFDVGARPDALQRVGAKAPDDAFATDLGFVRFNGAVHLTIGESF